MIEVPEETTGYIVRLEEDNARLRAREKRLVAALEFYADPAKYVRPSQPPPEGVRYVSYIEDDKGKRARAELNEVKGGGNG